VGFKLTTLVVIGTDLIGFVSDLQEVSGFLWVLRFSPPIKLTATSAEKNNNIQSDSLKNHFHVKENYLIIMGPSWL
jgi:hypothetical protein